MKSFLKCSSIIFIVLIKNVAFMCFSMSTRSFLSEFQENLLVVNWCTPSAIENGRLINRTSEMRQKKTSDDYFKSKYPGRSSEVTI